MVNFITKAINRKADLSTRYLRINLMAAGVIYLLFGLLDPFSLPSNYLKAWFIRLSFAFIIALMALYSFKPRLGKTTSKVLIYISVGIGSIGFYMISMIANPTEYAYLHYISGQCIILLWAMTSFRFRPLEISIIAGAMFICYSSIAIFYQKLHTFPAGSPEKSAFIGSLFFLSAVIALALYGAWRYNKYADRVKQKREQLKEEKKKLAYALKRIEENDRLKSAFLANMSHEIRTPMHAVLGFSQLLRRPDLTREKQEKFIDLIETKGQQLLGLIDNLLDLSRIDAQMIELTPSHFSVCNLFDTMKDQMLNSILVRHSKDFLHVEFNCPEKAPLFFTDFNRLSLVIFHLLDNAVKFTSQGAIRCIYSNDEAFHTIEIEDTGIGIAQEKVPMVFERFTQASNELNRTHSGTGLGLSIVTGLLKLMDGTIEVDSEENVGSSFKLRLPIKQLSE